MTKKDNTESIGDIEEKLLTRRKFCGGVVLTGAGALIATGAARSAVATPASRVSFHPAMRIEGARDMLPGATLLFSYPRTTDPAILVRADDGNFYGFSQKCSHLGCSVNYTRTVNRFDCPCHRGAYDMKTGIVIGGPPRRGLDEIILQNRGGEIWAIGRRSQFDNPIVA